MRRKSWEFGKRARKLRVVSDLEDWTAEGVVSNQIIEEAAIAQRLPSRMVPETLAAIVRDPAAFLVRKRRDWDIHKISHLQAGEIYPLSPSRELILENCWVHVPSGMVISADKSVVSPTCHAPGCFYEGHSDVEWDESPWIDEECFLLATVWGTNFAHWLMDALPRLSLLEKAETPLLLGQKTPDFQIQSLQILGFEKENLIVPSSPLVRCRRLRVHVAAPVSGVPHPACLAKVRERLRCETEEKPRRIYITRQGTRRKIINHDVVEPILEEFGFSIVDTETHDFQDQVQMFSNCEAILGAHGAGTMNVMFAPSGARLIEIFNPMVWDHAAHRVASLCGVSHFHCFGSNANREFDITVDPLVLRRTLALAFDNPGRADHPAGVLIEKTF